jgi:hypothetical protein
VIGYTGLLTRKTIRLEVQSRAKAEGTSAIGTMILLHDFGSIDGHFDSYFI